MEANEHNFPKDHPLRALFLADRPTAASRSGRSTCCCGTACARASSTPKTATSPAAARSVQPRLAPHLEFVDMGGHGYAKVRLSGDEMRTEFVCIPRPIKRAESPDGGPLRYRVVHSASLWKPGEKPVLRRQVIEGDPGLSI
jgi:alkaline phosphatase D